MVSFEQIEKPVIRGTVVQQRCPCPKFNLTFLLTILSTERCIEHYLLHPQSTGTLVLLHYRRPRHSCIAATALPLVPRAQGLVVRLEHRRSLPLHRGCNAAQGLARSINAAHRPDITAMTPCRALPEQRRRVPRHRGYDAAQGTIRQITSPTWRL